MRSMMLSLAIAAFGVTLSAGSAFAGACGGGSCPAGKAAEAAKCVCKADARCEGKCAECKCQKCAKPKAEAPKAEAPKAN